MDAQWAIAAAIILHAFKPGIMEQMNRIKKRIKRLIRGILKAA